MIDRRHAASSKAEDSRRFVIAMTFVLGFFVALFWMLYKDHPELKTLVALLVAVTPLAAKWYFDSSPGSERKTELLSKAQPIPPNPDDGAPPQGGA